MVGSEVHLVAVVGEVEGFNLHYTYMVATRLTRLFKFAKTVAAAVLTLGKEALFICANNSRPGPRIPARTIAAFLRTRAVKMSVVPVIDHALVVSMPVLDVVPVISVILPVSLPSRLSSGMISRGFGGHLSHPDD